ncbi:MAG: hypothetical protein MZV65_28990 [Chromatiales bacterium]|nr:hypothetical protein [Chromatiales bacterium]
MKVARTVTLVGRTQSDDDGIGQLDTGIQTVTFVLQRWTRTATRLATGTRSAWTSTSPASRSSTGTTSGSDQLPGRHLQARLLGHGRGRERRRRDPPSTGPTRSS